MYIPSEFKVTDHAAIQDFVERHPFAMLVAGQAAQQALISHLPMLVETDGEQLVLEGHLALQNPQAEALKNGATVTAVFQGPNAYVSSSVYTHHNVPTWNYQVVHLHGTIQPLTAEEVHLHLAKLTQRFEKERSKPLRYADFDRKMLAAYVQELLAFRVNVYAVEAAFKLSQNRNATDLERIIEDLEQRGANYEMALAAEMRKFLPSQ